MKFSAAGLKIKNTFQEYPGRFWMLIGASFIDSLGRTILFPFFTLYITGRFGVGMAQAGIILGLFSIFGMVGSFVGGALADKISRKIMIIAGLILSAGSSLFMGLINEIQVFYFAAAGVGLLSEIGDPARQAMIADILPEEKRTEGFGVFRVVHNLAWVVGPSIGGFLAARAYIYLFISDAVLSTVTALVILRFITDSLPKSGAAQAQKLGEVFRGYGDVFKDRVFIAYLLVSIMMLLVYQQLYSTFSVFLRDYRGFHASTYGMMMSINAAIVVLCQFWISRRVGKKNPFLMMALGTLFYLVGYTAFGYIHAFYLFLAAVIAITVGEMIMVPVQMSIVAKLSPEHMRGRYMAFSSFSWSIPSIVGPWAAGMIMDNYDPNLVWKICGVVSVAAIAGFYALYRKDVRS